MIREPLDGDMAITVNGVSSSERDKSGRAEGVSENKYIFGGGIIKSWFSWLKIPHERNLADLDNKDQN